MPIILRWHAGEISKDYNNEIGIDISSALPPFTIMAYNQHNFMIVDSYA